MPPAKRRTPKDWIKWFKEEKLDNAKKVLGHIGLYVGLVLFTAFGALMFQLLEHPFERERLLTLQSLLLTERENFLGLIFNLTASLSTKDLNLLNSYLNGNFEYGSDYGDEDYNGRDLRTYMLSTNHLHYKSPARSILVTSSARLNEVIRRLDSSLLDYEMTVAVAAAEGVNLETKEIAFRWTYVQSVFFTSTIITTVGYGHIAPVTVAGRAFCIFFAIIGIPFTLSVLADVGQIFATVVSTVGSKLKPVIMPVIKFVKKVTRRLKKRPVKVKRRKSMAISVTTGQMDFGECIAGGVLDSGVGGIGPVGTPSSNTFEDGTEDQDDDDDDEEDPMANMGIGANLVMAFAALASLAIFLSCGSFVFTHFEAWSFFEAFYYCFITMTTIGFGDMVPNISADKTSYMLLCMVYIIFGLAFTSTIIELVRRQYAESWRKMQELRAQIQAQLKLAEHLRKLGEQGRDVEGMDVDIDELRGNLAKYRKYGKGFDLEDLDWVDADRRRKVKAVTIFFYETSL